MIGKLNSFNIRTNNEKTVYYNYGRYLIFDLVTLDYLIVDETKYDDLLDNYRDYIKNKSIITMNETKTNDENKKQFIDLMFITGFDCNYSCTYCYQKEYKNIKSKMNTDDLDKIKEFYKAYDDLFNTNSIIETIGVMGGEPLLDANYEFIEDIFKKIPEAKIGFTTNASNIDRYKSLIKENKKRIDSITISIDGDKKTHFKYRKTLDVRFYDNIWDALEFSLNNNIEINISSLYHPEENKNYIKFFDKLEKHGWLENKFTVGFNLDIMKIESNDVNDNYINTAKKSFHKLMELDDRAKKLGRNIINYPQDQMYNMIKSKDSLLSYKSCGLTFKPSYTFLPTGDIYGCLGTKNSKFKVGTYKPEIYVNKENIENIYNRDVRNMPRCKECEYKYFCRGGCVAENLKKYDNLDTGYCSRWKEEDYKETLEKVFDQLIIEEITNADKELEA